MKRVLGAGVVGAVFMGVMASIPVISWANLFFGFWYFVGGILTALFLVHLRDGRRGLLACTLAAGLAGALVGAYSTSSMVASLYAQAATWPRSEVLQIYPDRDMDTLELIDAWIGIGEAAQAELKEEMREAEGTELLEMKRTYNKSEETMLKVRQMRRGYVEAESPEQRQGLDLILGMIHSGMRHARRGDPSPLVPWLLGFCFLWYGAVSFVAACGGFLAGLRAGDEEPVVEVVEEVLEEDGSGQG